MQDQGGCERRIEVFVKIQKKLGGGGVGFGGGGVRVDVNTKIEIFVKIPKKKHITITNTYHTNRHN